MDNRYYDAVIAEMKPFLSENSFVARDNGSFRSETKSVKIEYSEERQMYLLLMADFTEGSEGEYAEISSWLFDDSQNERDAASVGIDFSETLREALGVKITRARTSNVALPTAEKGDSMSIPGFTKKVLDVFPQYKDTYKAHIEKYGNFLYLDFFANTLVPQIRAVLNENTKKGNKKLFELLDNAYLVGDRETVNAVVAVVAAAVYNDAPLQAVALEVLSADTHFKQSVEAFIPVFASKKKLREALLK